MIREINTHDMDDVIILLNELNPADIVDKKLLAIHLENLKKNSNIKIYGYEHENRIVGMVTLGKVEGISMKCRPFAVIENVVVKSTNRNKGIGKKLVVHAMNQANLWNCYKVILETGTKQDWKLKFYEECGLVKGEKTAYIKKF